jgi:hypothetical protein
MPVFDPPRKVQIILTDDAGRARVAVAERMRGNSQTAHWNLTLMHDPSGRSWPADFHGSNILDALGELIERKDHEFFRHNGRAPNPMLPDRNVSVRETGHDTRAPVTTYSGKPVSFARIGAARARGDQ